MCQKFSELISIKGVCLLVFFLLVLKTGLITIVSIKLLRINSQLGKKILVHICLPCDKEIPKKRVVCGQ